MKDKVLHMLNALKNTRYFVKLICFAAICVVSIAMSLVFSDAVFAYTVTYGDEVIGIVENKKDFIAAETLAAEKIDTADAAKYFYAPKFSLTLTYAERINDNNTISQGILNNTDEIAKSYALTINGENVAYAAEETDITAIMDKRLSQYNNENYESSSEFIDDVSVTDIYYPINSYSTNEEIEAQISGLNVKTTVKFTTDVTVQFKTVTQKTATKLAGYYKVSTKGVNGLNHKVEQVVYIDGVETERTLLAQEVVREPVTQVVVVGTGSAAYNSSASGMIFPMDRSRFQLITTYYGEVDSVHSTPHKGMDYAAPKGTAIYAAKSGVVETAGTHSSYGKYIFIHHGNGVKTLYAHASALYVKAGETVTQGQTIAAVGSTGNSTGNHLHFEVIINGTRVNPSNYVG